MDFIENSNEFYEIISPLVKASGFDIVEFSSVVKSDGLYFLLVLYSSDGVSINDCGKIHRTLQRRLEAYTDNRDIYIEVSSPGINRNLKSANEFTVFTGKTVKVLLEDNSEWQVFKIAAANEKEVTLIKVDADGNHNTAEEKYQYSDIRKAKLV